MRDWSIGASLADMGAATHVFLLLHGRPPWLMSISSLLVVTWTHAWQPWLPGVENTDGRQVRPPVGTPCPGTCT